MGCLIVSPIWLQFAWNRPFRGKNCKIQMTQQSLLLFSFSRIGKKKRMENLIEIFSVQLKLEKSAIHFVHHQDGLDSLRDRLSRDHVSKKWLVVTTAFCDKCVYFPVSLWVRSKTNLSQDSLGLHANSGDAIDDDESAISHTQSGCHFRWKVNVPWS